MPSKPTDIREEVCSILEQLSDGRPYMRNAAARQAAEFSCFMLPSERPLMMLALRNMIARGEGQSDFLFGLHALGKVASEELPSYVTSNLPFTKKDAVRIVFGSCSLGWVAKKLPEGRIVKAGVKAVNAIAGGSPQEIKCALLEGISSKSRISRMIALTSMLTLELAAPDSIMKAALSTLDPEHTVRERARETYMRLSKFGHPLRPVVLCSSARESRNAAEVILNQGGPQVEQLREFAVAAFLLEAPEGNGLAGLLVERDALSRDDIEKYAERARSACYAPDAEERAARRMKLLVEKVCSRRAAQRVLPVPGRLSSMNWRPERARRPSQPPQRPSRPVRITHWAGPAIKA